jgi:hypothetical protein
MGAALSIFVLLSLSVFVVRVLSSCWGTNKRIRDSNTFSRRAGARHPLPLAERLGSKHAVVACR